jgi:hypothetical protein
VTVIADRPAEDIAFLRVGAVTPLLRLVSIDARRVSSQHDPGQQEPKIPAHYLPSASNCIDRDTIRRKTLGQTTPADPGGDVNLNRDRDP